jgi:hypothetical protein
MILDVTELPPINNLPDSVELKPLKEIQFVLPQFFVMVAVLLRLFRFAVGPSDLVDRQSSAPGSRWYLLDGGTIYCARFR